MTAPPVGLVLLAAGGSSRLGRPKQLVRLDGEPLVCRAARAAMDAGCAPVVVVLGSRAEEVEAALGHLKVVRVVNDQWARGIGSSIAVGVAHAVTVEPSLAAVIVALVDQPRVSAASFQSLVAAYRTRGRLIVAAAYNGTAGVPALFDRALFNELTALDGDRGAKPLIARHNNEVELVDMPEAAHDLDTPDDLDKIAHTN